MIAVDTVPLWGVPAESTNPPPVMRLATTRCPSSCSVIALNTGRNQVTPNPKLTQPAVRVPMPTSIERGASCAWLAFAPRGRARNVMAKAFTKHAAARAPVSASIEPASGNKIRVNPPVAPKPASRLW